MISTSCKYNINKSHIIQSMRTQQMLLLLILCIFLSNAQLNNYQERNLYYSETDNACREAPDQVSDYVNLIFNLDDKDRLKKTIYGETGCGKVVIRYADSIYPNQGMYYVEGETYVTFRQESRRQYTKGLLTGLIQNVTITTDAKIQGRQYKCSILGDGSIHHFGSGNGRSPA